MTPIGQSRHLNAAPPAHFGLHLADINIALGDLAKLVAGQRTSYGLARAVRSVRLGFERPRRILVRVTTTAAAVDGALVTLWRGRHRVGSRRVQRSARFPILRSGTYRVAARAVGAPASSAVRSPPRHFTVRPSG